MSGHAVILRRGEMGDIDFCAGSGRQFNVAGNEISVGVGFEHGNDAQFFLGRRFNVIVNVALWVNDRGFPARTNEV